MQKRNITVSVGSLALVALALTLVIWNYRENVGSSSYENPIAGQYTDKPYVETIISEKPEDVPASWDIEMSFTSQAPHANWDLPYQEACEEAAAITVHYYWQGKTFTPDLADQEILALVDFQEDKYGFYKDSTLAETKRFIEDYWGYNNLEIYEADDQAETLQKIKETISKDIPIIVPTAGRQLENPNFTPPGPIYHFLVIRGYTADGRIITNDPGTRNGEKYIYDWDILYNAIHDWNDGAVETGQKVILIANK